MVKFFDKLADWIFGEELVYRLADGRRVLVEYDSNQYAQIKRRK